MAEQSGSDSASINDRIASIFGIDADEPQVQPEGQAEEVSANAEEPQDEEPQETAEEQPAADSGYEEIDLDGEKYRVPPKLKEAVLRHEDYTRKTQEVAKAREHVTLQLQALQQQQQFQQFIEPEVNQFQQLQQKIKGYSDLEWLRSLDSEQRSLAQMEVTALKEQASEVANSIRSKKGQFDTAISQQRQQAVKTAYELIQRQIPDFRPDSETEKRTAMYVQGLGIPVNTFVEMTIGNPAIAVMAAKAAQFDSLKAGQKAAVEAVRKAPPVIKPGSVNPMPAEVRQNLAYRKAIKTAKTSQDKAKIISQRLESMFK